MEMLGKYGLLEKLCEENSETVYKARDDSLNRDVTLITLGTDSNWDPALKESFMAECRAILRLRHANLAAVYDQGEDRKIVFFVTELLQGRQLSQLIAENVLMSLEQKLALMIQAAGGLNHAHCQGVLHRSLDPGDIYVLPDGTVKVSGFGRGGVLSSQPVSSQSQPGVNLYQAPEQLSGKAATRQSDIFSIGIILYKFLTGTHPFHDPDPSRTVANILNRPQFPTVEQYPDLPFNLWPILERCLAKDEEERYATMQDFGSACQSVLEELAEDAEWMRIELQTALPRLRKAAKRSDAPPEIVDLKSEVEKALLRDDESDYLLMNRLVLALAKHHRSMDTSPEVPVATPDAAVDDLPVAVPAAMVAESTPVEPTHDAPEIRDGTPLIAAETGVGMQPDVAAPPAPVMSEPASDPVPEQNLAIPAPKLPEARASDPSGDRDPDTPATAPGVAAQNSFARPVSPIVEMSQTRASRRENLSELLRKIDQGQESTRRLVDNFLAGRQAQALAKEQSSTENSALKPAPIHAEKDGLTPRPPINPIGARPKAASPPLQEPPNQNKPDRGQTPSGEDFGDATADISAAIPRPVRRKTALWICASTLLLIGAFAVPWVRDHVTAGLGKGLFGQRHALPGGGQPVDPAGSAIQNQLKYARRDMLLEEAEVLHIIGRREESRVFLNRLLELYPGFPPALERLEKIKIEASMPQDQEDSSQPAQKLIGSAYAAIKAGNLLKAKSDLDKAEQLQPGLPEVASLRKQLDAKKGELTQKSAREQEEQLTAKRQKDLEALVLRTEELYRQGKYDEVLAIVDEYLARNPTLPQTQELRNRTAEVRLNLRAYETAVGAGRMAEARAALERIERINPADPNLPALRKRAEPAPLPGSASVTIYPIGEAAVLMLDDQPVGTGGELVNQTISSGRHKLTARNNGRQVELTSDFSNGQNITMVYDVAGQVLRAMTEADRGLIARSKARQELHRFAIEHSHGLLRGSCKGDLSIDYYHVIFRPSSGPHGFSVSFKELSLRIDNRNAVFLFAADDSEFFSFKLPDNPTAQKLRKVWDDVTALGK
jgi:serine/threonine protein kinase/tetratricopeptide (TPR) repeat protein